jgi:hypothetical protein
MLHCSAAACCWYLHLKTRGPARFNHSIEDSCIAIAMFVGALTTQYLQHVAKATQLTRFTIPCMVSVLG